MERASSLGTSRRAKVKPAERLSATGRGRKVDEEGVSERRLTKPKPPGGGMTRREERERPHHVTRTGFFAQREAGFQVGFVAPTGTSLAATATRKPREIFRSAAKAVTKKNEEETMLKIASVWGQPTASADDAHGGVDLGIPSAMESADHRLLQSMSNTRFFERGAHHHDNTDEQLQGEKEHHVRAAQALWSTNDGMALSPEEFAEVADHQDRLAALHVVEPHSDSEEEMEAVDKQRSRGRPTSVGRLSRVNMPEQLPVEVFLD
eukprot:COSAG02_NODE_16876_length_1049_cov_0.709474_1_plen_263_part_10